MSTNMTEKLGLVMEAMVKEEVDLKVKQSEEKVKILEKELLHAKEKINELENIIKNQDTTNCQNYLLNTLKENFNVNELESFLQFFHLKKNDKIRFSKEKDVPDWFYLLLQYYDDREKLSVIFDFLGINYPDWAKNFQMPYDYNKDVVLLYLSDLKSRGTWNGCYFQNNVRYFYENLNRFKGDVVTLFQKESVTCIPWQWFLMNPVLKEKEVFNRIIEVIQNNDRNSEFFFMIQHYQELDQHHIISLFEYIPKNNFSREHLKFFEKNPMIIKDAPQIALQFRNEINTKINSPFYYLNYPLDIQINYVKYLSSTLDQKVSLVDKMKLSRDEKLDLLNQCIRQKL
jgi:hypothetical protein